MANINPIDKAAPLLRVGNDVNPFQAKDSTAQSTPTARSKHPLEGHLDFVKPGNLDAAAFIGKQSPASLLEQQLASISNLQPGHDAKELASALAKTLGCEAEFAKAMNSGDSYKDANVLRELERWTPPFNFLQNSGHQYRPMFHSSPYPPQQFPASPGMPGTPGGMSMDAAGAPNMLPAVGDSAMPGAQTTKRPQLTTAQLLKALTQMSRFSPAQLEKMKLLLINNICNEHPQFAKALEKHDLIGTHDKSQGAHPAGDKAAKSPDFAAPDVSADIKEDAIEQLQARKEMSGVI